MSQAERKQFRARMGEFRRRPEDLTSEPTENLEALFRAVPELRGIADLRWKLTRIFDTAADRASAEIAIAAWRKEAEASGLDWSAVLEL